jgi:hypothetical protein
LEDPLKRLEEENKAKEEAEKEAARKAKVEAEKKAAAIAAAKKKAEDESKSISLARAKEREEHDAMTGALRSELTACQMQSQSVAVTLDECFKCTSDLQGFETTHIKIDPRIKPLFGNFSLEVVVLPLFAVLSGLFWLLGCCLGSSRVTPIVNPSAGSNGVTISEVVIRPGSEVCTIKNRSFTDVVGNTDVHCWYHLFTFRHLQDLTGCSLRVGSHVYHFDDGYNLAKATTVEIHAGPDAKDLKKLSIADHEKVR